nr:retrovirus-related Pol polyprotein from transposon TNT 1-94 [Tanacetum cinerariifolium]
MGEFRNKEMNDFCSQKGIKREFSNARTPQQNGVAERKNRTLIEAVRTMLADAKLPVTFWAEAVNTACYVQNRVLVNKSHNKTPYELFNGRSPAIGFLKPFGCHVMILNTLDNLGKFEEKGDQGYFIGYSMSSKAFRVFNKRTRRVEENLHVEFLENKAIEKGSGPNWLFDIDSLTKSINYVPVDACIISTNLSGTKDAASQELKKNVSSLRYIALPNWAHDALLEYSSMETPIPTVSLPVPTAYSTDSQEPLSDARLISKRVANQVETPSLDNILSLTNRFEDILGVTTNSDESKGVEADISNMETTIIASPTPTLRIHKDHPKSQIIEPKKIYDALQDLSWVLKNKKDERGIVIRNKARLVAQGHTQEERIDYDEVFSPVARIEVIRLFLAYASFMGFTVYQMDAKSAFLYGTIDEEVYVMQPTGFQDLESLAKVYKVEKAMYGLHQAPRAWYGTLSKYLLKNGFQREVRSSNTPMDKENPWGKNGTGKDVDLHLYRFMIGYLTASRPDIMFAVCACARHQVTPKECHLHAVKRIFRYLKGHPKLGLWYPKESPFDLIAYSDSDYGGATQDHKSTTGGCQFFGRRLSMPCEALSRGFSTSILRLNFPTVNRKFSTASRKFPTGSIKNPTADMGMKGKAVKPSVFGLGSLHRTYLIKKSEHNIDFHPMVDFIKASPLRIKTTEEGTQILATVDGIHRTITESSLRGNLKLQDEEGISEGSGTPTEPHHTPSPKAQSPSHTTHTSPTLPSVTTTSIPTVTPTETTPLRQYTQRARIAQSSALPTIADEPGSPLKDVSQGEAYPTESGFIADQDRATIDKSSTLPHDLAPQVTSSAAVEGSMQQIIPELIALYTTLQRQLPKLTDKFQAQEVEINRLKERVKMLEDREGVAATRSGDDAPIKGRREAATERISDDSKEMETVLTSMDAATVLASRVVDVPTGSGSIPTASTPAEEQVPTGSDVVPTASLVFATATVVTPYSRRKGKEVMVESEAPKMQKVQEQIDAQEYHQFALELPIERKMELITDLVKDFRGMTFKEMEAKFKSIWKQMEDFIPIGSKEEAKRIKRKGLNLEQESAKKRKTSKEVPEEAMSPEEVPEEKVKEMVHLVPIEEVYVEALQVKHPIIDWKHLDREDLNQLWILVKETLSNRPPIIDKEIELWVELSRLYEPDKEDQLWTHTQNFMHAPVEWKLYDSCGVHHVTAKDKEIFMLVKKDYPLRKGLALVMIYYKLQVENYYQAASDLILKIHKITSSSSQQVKKDATARRKISHWSVHKEERGRLKRQICSVELLNDFPFSFSQEATYQVCGRVEARCSFLEKLGIWMCECSCGDSTTSFKPHVEGIPIPVEGTYYDTIDEALDMYTKYAEMAGFEIKKGGQRLIKSGVITAYFIDSSLYGLMRTTSRSKSKNSFFKSFTSPGATLVSFMISYESVMERQRYRQEALDFKTIEATPKCEMKLEIELHAARVYTRTIFLLVQTKINEGYWNCTI